VYATCLRAFVGVNVCTVKRGLTSLARLSAEGLQWQSACHCGRPHVAIRPSHAIAAGWVHALCLLFAPQAVVVLHLVSNLLASSSPGALGILPRITAPQQHIAA
jgi:hypothetical protein